MSVQDDLISSICRSPVVPDTAWYLSSVNLEIDLLAQDRQRLIATAESIQVGFELRQNGSVSVVAGTRHRFCLSDDLPLTLISQGKLVVDTAIGSCTLRRVVGESTAFTHVKPMPGQREPAVNLQLVSWTSTSSGTKHSRISLRTAAVAFALSPDLGWLSDLAETLKAPEGAFANVVPSDTTDIDIQATQTLLRISPNSLSSRLVFELANAHYKTKLAKAAKQTMSSTLLEGLRVWLTDQAAEEHEGDQPLSVS